MSDVAALIADMVRAGVDPDLIGRAAAAFAQNVQIVQPVQDPVAEKRRAYDRERKAAKKNSTGIPPESEETTGTALPPKKENPQTPKEKTTPIPSEAKASSLSPRAELENVLDAEHADAVLGHRQRIGKPLTAYAARKLVAKMAKCADPNGAADEMVANGWQGFKPEWLESRSSQRSTAPPAHQGDGYNAVLNRIINGKHDEHAGPTIDASYDRADSGRATNLVQFDALSARNRT